MADDAQVEPSGFVRGLGRLDATMVVAGSMIGSGIFIVSADIARLMGSPALLLFVWLVTGALTNLIWGLSGLNPAYTPFFYVAAAIGLLVAGLLRSL